MIDNKQTSGFVLSLSFAAICYFISIFAAILQIALNRGLGINDLISFLIWTIPFAVLLGIISTLLIKVFLRVSVVLRYVSAISLGIVGGLLWSIVVAGLIFSPWLGAYSFSVTRSWLAGGIAGTIAMATNLHITDKRFPILALLIAIAVTVFPPLMATGQLTVIFIKWEPKSSPTTVIDNHSVLSPSENDGLKSLGGQFKVEQGQSIDNVANSSRILIVMQQQVQTTKRLLLPCSGNAAYLQQENTWEGITSDSCPNQNLLILDSATTNGMQITTYSVETPNYSYGSTAINWSLP